MIIEDINNDEIIIKDESRRFRKKIKVKMSFHDKRSYIQFNEDEGVYEVRLSSRWKGLREDELLQNWDLNHEIHHLFRPVLTPRWMLAQIHDMDERDFRLPRSVLLDGFVSMWDHRLSCLREDDEDKQQIMDYVEFYYKALLLLNETRFGMIPSAFLNLEEDMKIMAHFDEFHSNLPEPEGEPLKTAFSFWVKAHGKLREIQKKLTGVPIVYYLDLSITRDIYRVYDFLLFQKLNLSPEEAYNDYKKALKKKVKETPKKNFAERIRIKREIERIEELLKGEI